MSDGDGESPGKAELVPSKAELVRARDSDKKLTTTADSDVDVIVASRTDVASVDGHETRAEAKALGMSAHYSFSGPIPPPELFAKYEKAFRGAGGRILSMAEDEAKHRREMERVEHQAAIADARRGQYMGLAIILAAMGIGAWLIYAGFAVGVPAFFAGLASLFGAVILRKIDERKERKKEEAAPKPPLPPGGHA